MIHSVIMAELPQNIEYQGQQQKFLQFNMHLKQNVSSQGNHCYEDDKYVFIVIQNLCMCLLLLMKMSE